MEQQMCAPTCTSAGPARTMMWSFSHCAFTSSAHSMTSRPLNASLMGHSHCCCAPAATALGCALCTAWVHTCTAPWWIPGLGWTEQLGSVLTARCSRWYLAWTHVSTRHNLKARALGKDHKPERINDKVQPCACKIVGSVEHA
eukprot:1151273-Pelagomonas_calceolata.AAC.8